MVDVVLRLLPVVIAMAVGLSLRRGGMVDHRDGETVFKLVFYVFLPALAFSSLSTVSLTARLAIYPAASAVVIVAGYLAGRLVAARAKWDPVRAALLVSACMIANSGFTLPFVQVLYGGEGVARIAAFDAVNTTVTFSWVYYLAARANPTHEGGSLLLSRLAKSPPLYAIAVGLLVNLTGVKVPAAIADPTARFGSAVALLIPVGVGILFDPLGAGFRKAALIVATRLFSGLLVAGAIVALFGLSGMDRTIVLLIGVAPVAFASVTFSSLENLDVPLATSALSLSIAVSLVLSLLIIFVSA